MLEPIRRDSPDSKMSGTTRKTTNRTRGKNPLAAPETPSVRDGAAIS